MIATGAKPLTPPIPGIENAVFAEDVLLGKAIVNPGPVVVCGGGEVGAETADFIAQYRDDVTVLEMRGELCLDMMPITKGAFMEMMANSGVKSHVNATVKCIESGVESIPTSQVGAAKRAPVARTQRASPSSIPMPRASSTSSPRRRSSRHSATRLTTRSRRSHASTATTCR